MIVCHPSLIVMSTLGEIGTWVLVLCPRTAMLCWAHNKKASRLRTFEQCLDLAMRLLPAGSQFNYLPSRQSFSARLDESDQLYFL